MATGRPKDESEFGGAPGLVQPAPHKLTAAEQARLERAVNPADPTDTVDAVRARQGDRLA